MTAKQRILMKKKSKSSLEVVKQLEEIDQKLIAQNRFFDALTALMIMAEKNLKDARVWLLVGLVYTRMAYWQHAVSALETVLKIDEGNNQAKQLMSLALFSLGRKEDACNLIDQVAQSGNANGAQWMLRAYLHAHTSKDPVHTLEAAKDWGKRFADPLTRNAKTINPKNKKPCKKLKIGYVTADFREHSVAFFMHPILSNHDKSNNEIYVYSNGPSDQYTEDMRLLVDEWRDTQFLDDENLYKKIQEDEIDILIDLSGFTHGNRLLVFARRAAPVQVTWLGYMLPLGMNAMDYRLVGQDTQGLGHQAHFSEQLFYMPHLACYVPPLYAPFCEDLPMNRNGYPTLVSLNNSAKITDEILILWSEILCRRPDAKLIIMVKEQSPEAAQAAMQSRVENAGMPLDRVFVLHQQPLNQFMEMGHIADLALDTSPISGGTTTLHALWMGLPVIAIEADRDVDAASSRILNYLSFGGEVVKSEEDYVEAALRWLDNKDFLQEKRSIMREKMLASRFMDYKSCVADLESAFRLMWLNYLDGNYLYNNLNISFHDVMRNKEF